MGPRIGSPAADGFKLTESVDRVGLGHNGDLGDAFSHDARAWRGCCFGDGGAAAFLQEGGGGAGSSRCESTLEQGAGQRRESGEEGRGGGRVKKTIVQRQEAAGERGSDGGERRFCITAASERTEGHPPAQPPGRAGLVHACMDMDMDWHGRGWTSIVPVAVPDLEPRPGRWWWWGGGAREGMRVGFPPPGEPLHPTHVAIRWLGPCSGNMGGQRWTCTRMHSGNVGAGALEHCSTRTNPVALRE